MGAKNWLCRGDLERARLLDMSRRLRGRFRVGVALIACAVVAGVPTYGWGPLLPVVVAGAAFAALNVRLERFHRPEYAAALNWTIGQVAASAAIVLAHGPRLYLLALYIFPVMLGSVLFPVRVVAVGTTVSTVLMAGVAFALEPGRILDVPPLLVYPAVTLVCTALWASAARAADSASRDTAVVDRLTGLLNRAALEPRVAELHHQGRQAGEQIAVIAGDIDRFKLINDGHGHAVGDAVLQETGYRLRKALGAFDSAYRIGGEEFVVLLTGADAGAGAELAERLREAIRREPMSGCDVTMSFGVAASDPGRTFDYEAIFALADEALYAAKHSGRDRVRTTGATVPGHAGSGADDGGQLIPLRSARRLRRRAGDVAPVALPPSTTTAARRGDDDGPAARSWLAVDDVQRAHMLDLLKRLDRVGHFANALILATLLSAGPYFGWWAGAVAFPVGAFFQVLEDNLHRLRRPEHALAIAWLLASGGYAGAFFLSVNDPVAAIPFLILSNVGFSAVFPARGVLVGGAVQAVLIVVVGLVAIGQPVIDAPALLALPLALFGAITAIGTGVGQSAVEHRNASVLDPLTGLLNRVALEARVAELAHQVALTGERVALVIGDLDHFKAVNDRHGHAAGDAALRAVAGVLRANVRAFDSVYRLGGEEIAVLLPGLDDQGAAELAERLCEAVRHDPLAGMALTMSFGVTATEAGRGCDFAELFGRADGALYEAKRDGRDRVAAAPVSAAA